jgi:2-oxo-4-hydroxy-4-carboxy-5-ureidoimidazoline decarboxylase
MPGFLERWHALPAAAAAEEVLPCCGSQAWADALAASRPCADRAALLAHSDAAWSSLSRADWQQAFDSHPRLGEIHATTATATSLAWSAQEQAKAAPSDALRVANARYEQTFGRIFILCANGRTAPEMLSALERRLHNDHETEWQEAGEQQGQITHLRLERWLREQA